MNYFKSPTDNEKTEYCDNVKSLTILASKILGPPIILYLAYLIYIHASFVLDYGAIILLIAIITLSYSGIYYQTHKYYHMIYKRHRAAYYSTYMNYLALTIIITSVTVILFILNRDYINSHNIIYMILITLPTIILITTYLINKFEKEKPSLSPITEQEHKDREYLKSMYYYILEEKGFDHIESAIRNEGFNYLGILDFYMNHGSYEHEQVKKWKHDIHNEILTVKQVFKEMSEINQRNNITLYKKVCGKAEKKNKKTK